MPVEIHQIAKHDRHMSTLASSLRGRRSNRPRRSRCRRQHGSRRSRSRRGVQVGNRTQHFPTMSEQDAELLQILIRQIGENTEINSVIGKTLGILGQAKLSEPVLNLLHRGPPKRIILI